MQKFLVGITLVTCLTAMANRAIEKQPTDEGQQKTDNRQRTTDNERRATDVKDEEGAKTVEIDLNKKWGGVIQAIEQVESEGHADAVSRDGRYVGCLQISQILVRECNQIVGYQKFKYDDRYSKEKSHEMFIIYQEHFNREGNMERAIRLWNSGDLKCMQRKARTEGYYRRVMQRYNQLAKE